MPHFVLIGDVGSKDTFHVGDEAMLEANILRLRQHNPQVKITVVSKDPASTAKFYNVESVPYLDFFEKQTHADRQTYMQTILSAAQQVETVTEYPAIQVLADADGFFISGGGNLNSTWPQHLYERATLAVAMAEIFKKPVIITGQTIGPNINDDDLPIMQRLLNAASLLGIREQHSIDLLKTLDIDNGKIVPQIDDAFFLPAKKSAQSPNSQKPLVGITLHQFFNQEKADQMLTALVVQLDQFAELMDIEYLFIPHQRGDEQNPDFSDEVVGNRIKAMSRNKERFYVMDTSNNTETVWLTAQCDMILSSRYHPIVFGMAHNIPCIGISTSRYTYTKLHGALSHGQASSWLISISEALGGGLLQLALELWPLKDLVTHQFSQHQSYWQQKEKILTQHIYHALGLIKTRQQIETPILPSIETAMPQMQRDTNTTRLSLPIAPDGPDIIELHQQVDTLQQIIQARDIEIGNFHKLTNSLRDEIESLKKQAESLQHALTSRENELAKANSLKRLLRRIIHRG